jgi:hypothetical protein
MFIGSTDMLYNKFFVGFQDIGIVSQWQFLKIQAKYLDLFIFQFGTLNVLKLKHNYILT